MSEAYYPSPDVGTLFTTIIRVANTIPTNEIKDAGNELEYALDAMGSVTAPTDPGGDVSPLRHVYEAVATAIAHDVKAERRAQAGSDHLAEYVGSLGPLALETTSDTNSAAPAATPLRSNKPTYTLHPPSAPEKFSCFEQVLTPGEIREELLKKTFADAVTNIDLASLAVIPAGQRVPRSLSKFRLVPLTRKPGALSSDDSLYYTAYSYVLPDGVRATYGDTGKPYLDTGTVIGLVYGDWLVAVAGAGLDVDGKLKIIQLQDVTGAAGKSTPEDPKARFKTGLHDGFMWRDTLVNAWCEIARRTGVTDA